MATLIANTSFAQSCGCEDGSLWEGYYQAETDSQKIEELLRITYFQLHRADSVNLCLQKADSINRSLEDPIFAGKICEAFGVHYGWYLDDFDNARICFDEAIAHFKEDIGSSDPSHLGYVYDGLASMLSESGVIAEAFSNYFEAEQYFRQTNDTAGMIM
ncbi:MAG: hypothetical protein AAFQ87_26010, partial [Bacteroidota bacterium]